MTAMPRGAHARNDSRVVKGRCKYRHGIHFDLVKHCLNRWIVQGFRQVESLHVGRRERSVRLNDSREDDVVSLTKVVEETSGVPVYESDYCQSKGFARDRVGLCSCVHRNNGSGQQGQRQDGAEGIDHTRKAVFDRKKHTE